MKKENKVVKYVFKTGETSLNKLWELVDIGIFTIAELKEFYYLIGSSQGLIDDIERFN